MALEASRYASIRTRKPGPGLIPCLTFVAGVPVTRRFYMSSSWSYCEDCGAFGSYQDIECHRCSSARLERVWEEEDDHRRVEEE